MSDTPNFNLSIIETYKQARFDPLRNFDAQKLTLYLEKFRIGWLRDLALVIDAQEERDDTLGCVVPKAKSSIARHGYEVSVIERVPTGMDKLASEQKDALENFYNQLRVTNALDQDEVGGVSLLLRQMMDAKSKRYACHNIVWKPGSAPTATLWFTPLWFFENTTGKMRFVSQPYGTYGEPMADGEWLVTKGLGVGIACAVAWMFKHMSLRDWVLYNSRAGIPGVEGVTDSAPGTPQWDNMVKAVAAAASEFRWVRNRTEEIKTIDFGGKAGELPFPPLVERMDRKMTALWRGADLSTMSAGQGRGQGASVQQDETELLDQDDAQWLSEVMQLKLDRLVIDYVFGPEVPALAYFHVLGVDKKNVELDLKVDDFALSVGFPISQKQFAERYSRPLPEPDEELLTAPAKPAVPDQAAAGGDPAQMPETMGMNEASAAGREVLFTADAINRYAPEVQSAIMPIVSRLREIARMNDPEAQRSALKNLRAAMPELCRQAISRAPAAASVLQDVIGTAFASGVLEAGKARSGATPNDSSKS